MNLLPLLLSLLFLSSTAEARLKIGVNYGQLGNNLPPPRKAVELIQQLKIGKVKIYDANPDILTALANTTFRVMVMVPNQQIPGLATSQRSADEWVKHNVTSYYPSTRIRMVLVGNEILSDSSLQQTTWPVLVPAMKNIYTALKKLRLHHKIKVSTPHALSTVLQNSDVFPPSNGTFRSDLSASVLEPMLKFLQSTKSPFCVDAYPFFTWEFNRETVPLELALFRGNYTDPGSGLFYDNLLDIQLDAVAWAFRKLGGHEYDNVDILVTETGWPTKGGVDERGANVYNAATYNRRLVQRVLKKPAVGTPLRRCRAISTYIFALFNENLKPGPVTERNWGLLTINDNGTVTPSYDIDLQGRLDERDYKPLPKPPPEPLPGTVKLWCIGNQNASTAQLQGALSYACGQPGINCTAIQAGQACFSPDTVLSHASYAFNDYYVKQKVNGGSCDFNGAANLTMVDPSYGKCKYNPLII